MPATGEKTYDWSGPEQNPYVHADFSFPNINAQILNGGLRSAQTYGGPAKCVYNGTVNRDVDIISRVEFTQSGSILFDPRGPALTDPDTGVGYWLRIDGDQARAHRQDSASDSGTQLSFYPSAITIVAGDIFEIGINTFGLITFKQNDTILGYVTDTTYLATVAPAGQVEHGNQSATALASIGMDGVAEDVVIPPNWVSSLLPPPAEEGTPYSYDFSSLLEGTPPLLITDVGQPLPDGLSATSTTIEGTPTVPGSFLGCALRVSNGTTGEDSPPFDMTVTATGVIPPVIDNVNTDNTFTSNAAGVVNGSGFTDVVKVFVGNAELDFTIDSDIQISYLALDLHNTEIPTCATAAVTVTTASVNAHITVALEPQAGNICVVTEFIDEDPTQIGLLGTTTAPAVAGDIYEGEQTIGGSAVVYDPYGPHRDIQPAVPNGTTSTGWHYSVANLAWGQINETTNQTSTPGATLSDPYHAVTDTTIGVTFTTNTGRGTIYVVATLTNELPNPTPEEIKAGVGESAVSFVVTATGAQEPAYLEGLDPITRYWYWIVQDTDGLNTFSNVASGTALTTATPVGTPGEAILTNPFTGVSGGTFGSVGVTSSSSLGMLYFVAMLEPEEPSEDDIKFGIGAASHSSAVPKVGVNGPYLLDGLDPTQLYYYWFVQDTNTDESGE